MRSLPLYFRRAFTLIELLTVIAIVGILAAILIPAVTAAKNAAKRAQTKTQFTQWATAMTGFKQEYGYYPIISTNSKVVASTIAGACKFSPPLCGKADINGDAIAAPTAANTGGNIKLISFYTLSTNDIYTGVNPAVLTDAYGNTDIAVQIDTNGDGKIDANDSNQAYLPAVAAGTTALSNTSLDVKETDPAANKYAGGIRAGVIFYSAGRGLSNSDIITTWQ